MPKKECLRCGHKWIPRTDNEPVLCPSCKSKYWNQKRKESVKKVK